MHKYRILAIYYDNDGYYDNEFNLYFCNNNLDIIWAKYSISTSSYEILGKTVKNTLIPGEEPIKFEDWSAGYYEMVELAKIYMGGENNFYTLRQATMRNHLHNGQVWQFTFDIDTGTEKTFEIIYMDPITLEILTYEPNTGVTQ